MAKQYSPEPEAALKPVDDFKLIHGIGPGLESRLHAAGIRTYGQLASMTPEDVVLALGNVIGLTMKRVVDQNWIGQARQQKALKRQKANAQPKEAGLDSISPKSRQHYAVYTVELLLDEENNVRRTRVINVQSQTEGSWAGWEEQRLLDFLSRSASLKIPQPQSASMYGAVNAETTQPLSLHSAQSDQGSIPIASGELRLSEMALRAAEAERPHKLILRDEAFSVQLTLDLTHVSLPRDRQFDYSAVIYARKMGNKSQHQMLGKADGKLLPSESFNVEVKNLSLPHGAYRLEAFVTLNPTGPVNRFGSRLTAMTESGLIQIN